MTEKQLEFLSYRLLSVSVFKDVCEKEPMVSLSKFLTCKGTDFEKVKLYADFVNSLGVYNGSFSAFLKTAVCESENFYITAVGKNKNVSPSIKNNAESELQLFSDLTKLTREDMSVNIEYSDSLPLFENEYIDFVSFYSERLKTVSKTGYGIFALHGMFQIKDGELTPVESADKISIEDFVGYEEERQQVFENTRALVEGRPAANILLCGDAGTGKSSTVKASANMFFSKGVRLIEIRKDQLFSLPYIMGRIENNPLKFIIFIDDLSFNKNDDSFSMLKAVLEGSASVKSTNAVIYATSNRRHIVKETFSEREQDDDIHHSDTVQELLSLSERFGMVVYFSKPSKQLYLAIVHELAKRAELSFDEKELDLKAEAFALSKGSRSPRVAQHFINSLL